MSQANIERSDIQWEKTPRHVQILQSRGRKFGHCFEISPIAPNPVRNEATDPVRWTKKP